MMALLLSLSLLFLLAAIYPFLLYPLSLVAIREFRFQHVRADTLISARPNFTLCFCAYNEERVIDEKLENLQRLKDATPDLEILAYVDAATDRTAERILKYPDLVKCYVSSERHGKTYGMNKLVETATGDIIVFTDANVMVDPEALLNLGRYFVDSTVGCVAGHLTYVNPDASVTASNGSLYWRLEEWIKKLEAETGSGLMADGSLFAIRRSLHRPVPDDVIDDMYVSLNILCDGYRIISAPDVRAYEASVTLSNEEFQRKIRIACQAFNVHRLLWPRIRRLDSLTLYKYISHKFLRWFSFYNLVLGYMFFEATLLTERQFFLSVLIMVASALGSYAGSRWKVPVLSQIVDLLSALMGAGIGVWKSQRGERFQTWTLAKSIR